MCAIAVGMDLHRKFSQVSLQQRLDSGETRVLERHRLDHLDRAAMEAWLRKLPPGTPVAMEGAFGWQWMADLLIKLGLAPHLGHPPAIKVLTKREAKGDRVDADRLARLWLRGTFPACYLSTPEVRQLRERLRHRMSLVRLRSLTKNRIQALLHRAGMLHGYSDLFGKGGRKYLAELSLPEGTQAALADGLALVDLLGEQIAGIEAWMIAHMQQDEIVRWLASIPGVGLVLAHVIRAEIGQLAERFPSAKHLTSYAGLAPLSDDSADRHGRRHISAACNRTLRWAFIEAAAGAVRSRRCPPKFRKLHDRLTHGGRVNKNQARVAVARELCELVYVLWKKGEPFREVETTTAPSRASRATAR